ncbi:E3 ubiquitin-protein ligase At3g02290 [Selaginella moellendorffii]|uniref:E3 ubiquitin-protein ligase At3g02290 n=1 Tax=Selaginella moellendorffii TaxID=88036 RepID=UPI000D1C4D12|nr:E3 ubiquitin-protein ligase At3g02290 [Selaginella moellendorffii]|eukprot:XP_024541154.1 E3 ubiquitin-protein ligase At3g02290 [Selaginella moellendorffii]
MGSLCCCPVPENVEELVSYPNGTLYQRCACLQGCMRWLLFWYASMFERIGPGLPSTHQSPPSASGLVVSTPRSSDSLDTFRAPPRPLPYDVDARYVRLPRDGLVSRRDKIGMSHYSSESGGGGGGEALALLPRQSSDSAAAAEHAEDSDSIDKQQLQQQHSSKLLTKSESMLSLIDDEDACPTCLDVYTPENPKINTECGHHYHLACILEWMERSKHCPVCDKEMVFHESTVA